jgi:hypothetical protein
VYVWQAESGGPLSGLRNDGLFASPGAGSGLVPLPGATDVNGDGAAEVLVVEQPESAGDRLRAYAPSSPTRDSLATSLFASGDGSTGYGEPVAGDSLTAVAARHDRVLFFRPDGTIIDSLSLGLPASPTLDVAVCSWSTPGTFVVTGKDGTVLITSRLRSGPSSPPDRRTTLGTRIYGWPVAGSFRRGAELFDGIAVIAGDRRSLVYLLDGELNLQPGFPVDVGGSSEWIALGDMDGDGGRDIVVFAGAFLHVYSAAGVPIDNFPVELSGGTITTPHPLEIPGGTITTSPVIADINGDGRPEVVGATASGIVFAFGSDGRQVPGFPLQAGRSPLGVVAFDAGVAGPSGVPIGLAVVSGDQGTLNAWVTGTAAASATPLSRPWPMPRHDARNTGAAFDVLTGRPLSTQFFPPGRAYNWPNPVYDGRTYIRYYLGGNATVRITVYDFAGDKVAAFPGPGIGGMDNEVAWDVSGVQSGVYFARIEASGEGHTGSTIVRVAVVK